MNRKIPALTPQKVIRALLRAGFFIHHISGSHHILKHPDKPNARVTIAYHSKDLKRKTLIQIIEQADMNAEQFLRFLAQLAKQKNGPTLVFITHHVEEIIPAFTHVLLLKEGTVHAMGKKAVVLNSKNLAATFKVPLTLVKQGPRYELKIKSSKKHIL